jgi:small subunit ribosomal protein S17
MAKETRNNKSKRVLEGTVVSNKMDKTVKVVVETPTRHPKYHKVVSKRKTHFARTEDDIAEGSTVLIEETKPIAKNVYWRVIEVKE